MFHLRCFICGRSFDPAEKIYTCPDCGGILEAVLELDRIEVKREDFLARPMGVWRYREFMPVGEGAKIVTLDEGGTPLYHAENLGRELGMRRLYIKNEGANPTGSFKDRGMTMGVTKAIELGAGMVGCASTGNTSASLAAFASKANIPCVVLLPAGKIAMGKLAQAILHGARVIGIRGNFDQAQRLIREAASAFNIYLLNSINPWRLEGQKTEAFEVVDQLGWEVPDRIVIPVGNCGNISAMWKGFNEFHDYGIIDSLPKMTGIQASGASPVVRAVREGLDEVEPEKNPETVATAIRIGAPVNAPKALRAIRDSGGT
ncbi:MAG: threonine synthase, partial [Euryarchaeota archaeon]|nr:threonine synthase [Euryarchaeota archaeon]